jgi:hypothetical protein
VPPTASPVARSTRLHSPRRRPPTPPWPSPICWSWASTPRSTTAADPAMAGSADLSELCGGTRDKLAPQTGFWRMWPSSDQGGAVAAGRRTWVVLALWAGVPSMMSVGSAEGVRRRGCPSRPGAGVHRRSHARPPPEPRSRGRRGDLHRLISTSSTHALIAADTKASRIAASTQ